jgi:hypothetical protein
LWQNPEKGGCKSMTEENKKQSLDLTIFRNDTEEQAVQKVREAQAALAQRRRDEVLYNSADVVSSFKALPDLFTYHPFPTPVPTSSEWKNQWKKETPKKIAEKLEELKAFEPELQDFSKNFDAYSLQNIPCNWDQYHETKDEYVADVRKTRHEDFETVEEAKKYVQDLIEATEEALTERLIELSLLEAHIEPLAKQCRNLVAKLNSLHPEILKDKRKAELEVLEEKELLKIVQRLQQYNELNRAFDAALDELARVSVGKPEVLSNLPRPQQLPPLPAQLEKRIKRR